VRLSSWFPFNVNVVLNGREWLARQMDRKGIDYLRRDNCFPHISDFTTAQQLANQQVKTKWIGQLDRLLRRVHPLHAKTFTGAGALDYYWTSEQTEWATDILFRDAGTLSDLYQRLTRRGIDTLKAPMCCDSWDTRCRRTEVCTGCTKTQSSAISSSGPKAYGSSIEPAATW